MRIRLKPCKRKHYIDDVELISRWGIIIGKTLVKIYSSEWVEVDNISRNDLYVRISGHDYLITPPHFIIER